MPLSAADGSRGFQSLQFQYPRDVAVDRNGKVYVTELWRPAEEQVGRAELGEVAGVVVAVAGLETQ